MNFPATLILVFRDEAMKHAETHTPKYSIKETGENARECKLDSIVELSQRIKKEQ